MKHLTLILLISLLIAGCKTTKRIAQTETRTQQTAVVDRSAQLTEKAKTQANKKVVEETTETTVEYYPPLVNSTFNPDSIISTGTGIEYSFEPNKGPVKSVTTRTTTRKEVDQGTAETEKTGNEETKSKTTATVEQETKEKEVSKPNSRMFLIIFGVGAVAGIVVYMKWKTIFPWIKRVLSFTGINPKI